MHQGPWFAAEEDVVGLDVGDGIVSAARVKVGRDGAIRLLNVGWTECPVGASVRDMTAAIRHVWRTAAMPSVSVCAAFRSRSTVLRYFKYPAMSPEEFDSALRMEAEESLQLPQEEILLDWHLNQISGPGVTGTGQHPYEGLLAAAPAKDVEQFLAVLRGAGLYPVILDLGAMAVGNLFRALRPDLKAGEDVCIVHLTRQGADIAVLFDHNGLYARTVFAQTESWESSIEHLAEGVKDALKYYEFKLRHRPPQRLLVSGRIPRAPDFIDGVRTATGIPAEIWDPLAQIVPGSLRVRRLLARRQGAPPLAASIGLALRRYDDA